MKFELEMFKDLNTNEMELLRIKEVTPDRSFLSFATNGLWLHQIIIGFFPNNINIISSTNTNTFHLRLLDPFVEKIKGILCTDHEIRLQMILHPDYCKVEYYVPEWCSSDLKYALYIEDYLEEGIYFQLKHPPSLDEERYLLATWSFTDNVLSPIQFHCEHPPFHLVEELESFTTDYIQKQINQ